MRGCVSPLASVESHPSAHNALGWGTHNTSAQKPSAIIESILHFADLMDEEEAAAEIPSIMVSAEGPMETPSTAGGARRDEDIALDLMKFVAMTTGFGRTTSSGVGFQGSGAAAKPEEYASHLLELYGKCLDAVGGKK